MTSNGIGKELPYRPRDLNDEALAKLNHAEWLDEFSQILALPTPVQMTPKRQGTITRLHWAAEYVRLLEVKLRIAEEKLADKSVAEIPEGR